MSKPINELVQEPELLRVDAERIRRQMQEVAVANYRAFISAADALLAIRQEVSSIDKHLDSLVQFLFLNVTLLSLPVGSGIFMNMWPFISDGVEMQVWQIIAESGVLFLLIKRTK